MEKLPLANSNSKPRRPLPACDALANKKALPALLPTAALE